MPAIQALAVERPPKDSRKIDEEVVMFKRALLRQAPVLFVVLASVAAAPVQANNIGARLYSQFPWDPKNPSQDDAQIVMTSTDMISKAVGDAWHKKKGDVAQGLYSELSGYKVAPGIVLRPPITTLNEITDYSIRPAGTNTARLQFRVPATRIDTGVSVDAINKLDKWTANIASSALSPTFSITFDIVAEITLAATNNLAQEVQANEVHVTVEKLDVQPTNDAAKALKGINDLIDFFGGPNFLSKLQSQFDKKDVANQTLLDAINTGLLPLNQPFQIANKYGYPIVTSLWGDQNRLTLCLSPGPLNPLPTDGQITGNIYWDPNMFPSASYRSFFVAAQVQTAPRPVLNSDATDYGNPPMQNVGSYEPHPEGRSVGGSSRFASGNQGSCSYTIIGVPQGWPDMITGSTTAHAANGEATNDPYAGQLHTVAAMTPVGWNGVSAVASAANIDYQLSSGIAGEHGVGNPHAVAPGVANETGTVVNPGDGAQYGERPWVRTKRLQRGRFWFRA